MNFRLFSLKKLASLLWDTWCVVSIVGIWPRFIEPNILKISRLKLPIKGLHSDLEGLKIVQFSDLHFRSRMSVAFLNKIVSAIKSLDPDIVVFTGDFLCFSQLEDPERFRDFLCSISSRYGNYYVFGNHDYERWVSINSNGDYDCVENNEAAIVKGLKRLFKKRHLTKVVTSRAREFTYHKKLCDLLHETPFKLLENRTEVVPIKEAFINIAGLGEYSMGRCNPDKAFQVYDLQHPGIVLSHNPDCFSVLKKFPGDIVLAGHTHGGQVNIFGIWKKLTSLENKEFRKGLIVKNNKKMYVNRGVGSSEPFRWFAPPELLLLTLTNE